ncbi:MAG: sugar transferase [Planctomycetia bacterium]|nr:sugar transferase [Planctomycetia bacterium]
MPRYFKFRRWFDRFIAALLLIPGLPIMLCTAVLLILTSDGPVFYRQRRVGLHGKVFTLIKFRTMIQHAEKKTGPVWTSVNDPRITKVGKILRPTHIDELPQIFNVLLGEMMLIGPRPERPEFTCKLEQEIPGYNQRSLITPGVTGLAQMNLPPDTDLESVRRKLTLDLEYIRTGSFGLDFRIFCATFLRLFGIPGSLCVRWAGVRRDVVVPDYMYRSDSESYIQRKLPQTYIDGMASQAFSSSKES